MNNDFRLIASLENKYEVNADGTVIRNAQTKRPLKIFVKSHNSKTQYCCTQVNINHRIRKVFIHRVVAECWHGEKPEGLQVDHIDRNSLNNHYSNLRYVTKSEQMLNRDYSVFQDRLMENLAKRNKGNINPVTLLRNGEALHFSTARRAAKYLTTVYPDKKEKSFNDKFYLRRKRIFDYDVIYEAQRKVV